MGRRSVLVPVIDLSKRGIFWYTVDPIEYGHSFGVCFVLFWLCSSWWIPGNILCMGPANKKTKLHCNGVSHWLGTYTKWSLGFTWFICIKTFTTDSLWSKIWVKIIFANIKWKEGMYHARFLGFSYVLIHGYGYHLVSRNMITVISYLPLKQGTDEPTIMNSRAFYWIKSVEFRQNFNVVIVMMKTGLVWGMCHADLNMNSITWILSSNICGIPEFKKMSRSQQPPEFFVFGGFIIVQW